MHTQHVKFSAYVAWGSVVGGVVAVGVVFEGEVAGLVDDDDDGSSVVEVVVVVVVVVLFLPPSSFLLFVLLQLLLDFIVTNGRVCLCCFSLLFSFLF